MVLVTAGVFCSLPRGAVESATYSESLSRAQFVRQVNEFEERHRWESRTGGGGRCIKDILEAGSNAFCLTPPSSAAELQAEAQWEDMVFDHHIGQLSEAIAVEDTLRLLVGSPDIAMSSVSKSLCGTDFAHHRDFGQSAESWRKRFVTMLNETFAEDAGAAGWEYKAGPEVWSKAPPFEYAAPPMSFAVTQVKGPLAALLSWLLISFVAAAYYTRRMKVV